MLICIYIYSYNAIWLWYKLYSEPILAYAFPVPLAFASHLLAPTARERKSEPTITCKAQQLANILLLIEKLNTGYKCLSFNFVKC